MKKTMALLISLIIIFSTFSIPMTASAASYTPDVDLYSEAYMLVNLDDDSYPVVAEKNQDEKLYPASLTKIVTAILTINNVSSTSEMVTMSSEAYNVLLGSGAQVAGIEMGDEISVLDLLYLSMVFSACDACEMLAEYVGGTRDNFIAMMNEYASSLGCQNTHFTNPTGLHDDDHYTTVSDMAAITLDALKNETFTKIAYTTEYEYNGRTYLNTNLMLLPGYVSYYYKYAQGIKTGSTTEAGYCVITEASKNGYDYLAVVMDAPRIDYNDDGYIEKCSFIDAASLFDWAFNQLKYTTLFEKGELIDEVPVKNGKNADTVQLVTAEAINEIVPASLDKSAVIIEVKDKPDELSAPIDAGDKICTADIIYGDEVILTMDLVAGEDIELSTFLTVINAVKTFFSYTVVKIIIVAFIILIIIYILLVYRNYKKKRTRRSARIDEENIKQNRGNNSNIKNDSESDGNLPPPKIYK